MFTRQQAIDAARSYLKRNPFEVARVVRSAVGLRFGLPLDAMRWLADQVSSPGKLEDVRIDASPPGLRVAATVEQMKTRMRIHAALFIERVSLTGEEMRVELRLDNVKVDILSKESTPVSALILSGALDLSKPGNLARHLSLPPMVVDAHDNKFVLDLMRHPKLKDNPAARRMVGLLTSLVSVHNVETDGDHLDVSFRALPSGVVHAASLWSREVFLPSMRRVRELMPGRR